MAQSANGTTNGLRSKFPEIFLDLTLSDLLAEEPDYKANESLCNMKPCADPRHTTVPLNTKYLITSAQANDSNDLAHLQLENVHYLLSFWAGAMEVPMIACEGSSDDVTLTQEAVNANAVRAFSIINEAQRPRARTFCNKDDFIEHYGPSSTRVRWGFAVDFAERMRCFVHPEVQYQLNSKRWLAECRLRSANDRIIDPQCSCPDHETKGGLWYFGRDCKQCQDAVDKEVDRLKKQLEETKAPYVLKVAQSLGSVGTMLVKDEDDKAKTIKDITKLQAESLPFLTADNAHIYPTSLVLSDMLPGDTHALNFYVRKDGSVKLLGACHQLGTRISGGGIQHTALTWSEQAEAEKRFRPSLDDIGKVLHDEGYFGPCGADIMETEDGTQYVIDLNVRTTTSSVLSCLRTHCKTRGFGICGVYECMLLSLSRDDLEREFEKEFQEGRIILLGDIRLGKKDIWAYPLVVTGEDQEALQTLGERLLNFKATGSEDAQDAGGA